MDQRVSYLEIPELIEKCAKVNTSSSYVSVPSIKVQCVHNWWFNRDMYKKVGKPWRWIDRLGWGEQQWQHYAAKVTTFVATLLDSQRDDSTEQAIGYFELATQPYNNVQLVYFGLVPQYTGKGLGRVLLQHVKREAYQLVPQCRLWLHTCSNDHPAALQNYRNNGFVVYRTKIHLSDCNKFA